ncbi:MAG: acetyltransferase [Gammaproteobacteria bacterium]
MLSLLMPPTLAAILAGVTLILACTIAGILFIPFTIAKALVPIPAFRHACTDVMFAIARQWASFNRLIYRLMFPIAWEIDVRGTLDPHRSYLLIGNHQSWIDILLVFDQFTGRTPPVCFFLKRELLWVPVIGWSCWGMDFPFMSRRSHRSDVETTRRFCERYRDRPVTVVNFAEGTRFSEAKRVAKHSPYRHLLRPKAGGMALTLGAMGEQFAGIIDVTIAYRPSRHQPTWSFLLGEQADLAIQIDVLPVPQELLGGDYSDPKFRERFQVWLNALWARKDAWLERMINRRPAAAPRPRMT